MPGRTYVHQLDAKNRMRIPAKLREEIGKNYTIMAGSGGCLYVYNEEQAKKLKEKLQHVNPFNEKQLKAARLLLSLSWDAEEDKQGRILIPDNIRDYVHIQKNVVVFNGPNCVEIWAEEVWNDYFNDVDLGCLADVFND
jgi:MraZ protein